MTRNDGLIGAVFLAWPVVVAVLTRLIGPRWAVLVGLLGGHLYLPAAKVKLGLAGFALPVDRWIVISLALVLGPLIFDRRTLFRFRPSWLDLPMLAYYLAPLIGLVTGQAGTSGDILDMMVGRGLVWVVPYVMGRVYFSDGDGPLGVAVALVIAGLSYLPICVYEEFAGPENYLGYVIYGIPYGGGMVHRLGGYRPEGFLNDGIAVAAWMALTTVTATWLWLGGRRIGRCPGWIPALALLLATLSCRGVYGYLILAIGLPAALLTRWLRSRAILAALLLVPILYMGLRGSGAWDGKILVRAVAFTGREGTVGMRLHDEDFVIDRVAESNPAFGLGGYLANAKIGYAFDGRWVRVLWAGGLVGLALQVLTFHALPAALALARPPGRPDPRQAAAPSWALACWCILHLFDSLHNVSYFTPTALVAGCLVGFASWKGVEAPWASPKPLRTNAFRRAAPVPLIATVLVLIAVEVLGRWRASSPSPPSPPSPVVEKRDARP
jgi:hypothetical protein